VRFHSKGTFVWEEQCAGIAAKIRVRFVGGMFTAEVLEKDVLLGV